MAVTFFIVTALFLSPLFSYYSIELFFLLSNVFGIIYSIILVFFFLLPISMFTDFFFDSVKPIELFSFFLIFYRYYYLCFSLIDKSFYIYVTDFYNFSSFASWTSFELFDSVSFWGFELELIFSISFYFFMVGSIFSSSSGISMTFFNFLLSATISHRSSWNSSSSNYENEPSSYLLMELFFLFSFVLSLSFCLLSLIYFYFLLDYFKDSCFTTFGLKLSIINCLIS